MRRPKTLASRDDGLLSRSRRWGIPAIDLSRRGIFRGLPVGIVGDDVGPQLFAYFLERGMVAQPRHGMVEVFVHLDVVHVDVFEDEETAMADAGQLGKVGGIR